MLAFHAAHSIHTPLETLPDAFEHFAFIEDSEDRRAYHSMVWNVDRDIGKIVAALKSKGMYQNSLVVLSADNGGPVYMSGRGGGNNFPLRGVCQNIGMVEQKLLPFSIKLTQSLMYKTDPGLASCNRKTQPSSSHCQAARHRTSRAVRACSMRGCVLAVVYVSDLYDGWPCLRLYAQALESTALYRAVPCPTHGVGSSWMVRLRSSSCQPSLLEREQTCSKIDAIQQAG